MTTVYDSSTNSIFHQTPSTYLEENSDRLTPSPASYPTPSSNTVSPESYLQSSPASYPNFYPSPDSSHSSAGSPLAPTSLPDADQADSNITESLSGSATYSQSHEGQNCNFYEYMYSSFPAYQHQTPSFYPSQMNSVPDGDFYQAHSSYFTNHPYYPYLYSNKPSPTPQCNLYNRQLLTHSQDLNSTSQTLNVIPEPSQNSSTKVRLKQQKSGFKTSAPYIAEPLSVSHAAHYLRAFLTLKLKLQFRFLDKNIRSGPFELGFRFLVCRPGMQSSDPLSEV